MSAARDGEEGAVHRRIELLLASREQRYTSSRRAIVDALAGLGRPAVISELLGLIPGLAASTAYRNLTILGDAGVLRRVSGTDEFGRFELSEEISGRHHHHVVCADCGLVLDAVASVRLEVALAEAAKAVAEANGFDITDHRLELVGRCGACQ
jgi:Fur family transcriptional regulator, ferric uptake regulator